MELEGENYSLKLNSIIRNDDVLFFSLAVVRVAHIVLFIVTSRRRRSSCCSSLLLSSTSPRSCIFTYFNCRRRSMLYLTVFIKSFVLFWRFEMMLIIKDQHQTITTVKLLESK